MNAPIRVPRPAFTLLKDCPAHNKLRDDNRWVGWFYLYGDNPERKPRKIPLDPKNQLWGSTKDPSTWTGFEQASGARQDRWMGLGYVITHKQGLIGIDLDGCRDPVTGVIEPWAREVIDLAETYVEVSPSGTGLRLIAEGSLDTDTNCKPAGVEIYGGKSSRFLTITGQHVAGTPDDILPAPKTLATLARRVEGFEAAIEAEIVASEKSAPSNEQPRGGFFYNVNQQALAHLTDWVPELFYHVPFSRTAKQYRLSPEDLDRAEEYEEDLSITSKGIKDFAVADMGEDPRRGKRTAIDLVIEWHKYVYPQIHISKKSGALELLALRLGRRRRSLRLRGSFGTRRV